MSRFTIVGSFFLRPHCRPLFLLLLISFLAFAGITPKGTVRATPGTIGFLSTWGGSNDEVAQGLTMDSNGNLYLTGYTTTFGTNTEAFLLKYTHYGTLLNQLTWGGLGFDAGYRVAVDGLGNIYVMGETQSFSPEKQIFILKLDSSFNPIFQFLFDRYVGNQPYRENAGDMVIDSSSNIYMTGTIANPSGGIATGNIFLLKLNFPLGVQFYREWGDNTNFNSQGTGIALDPTGNIYVTGSTNGPGAGGSDVVLLKFDKSGTLLWQKTWGRSFDDYSTAISVDPTGSLIYVTGYAPSDPAGVFLLQFSQLGVLNWERAWGPSAELYPAKPSGLSVDSLGNVYLTGTARVPLCGSGENDAFLVKYDPSGVLNWILYLSDCDYNGGEQVLMDSQGYLFATGWVAHPPYTLSPPPFLYQETPTPSVASPDISTMNASVISTPVSGGLSIPSGSTTYAGGVDAFLLRYDIPYTTVTVATQLTQQANPPPNPPPHLGVLQIGGHNFTNGQMANLTFGNYTAKFFPSIGFRLTNWHGSGGVTLSSDSSNPTNVTLTGPGTLTANLAQVPGRGFSPQVLFLSIAPVVVIAGFRRRLKQLTLQ